MEADRRPFSLLCARLGTRRVWSKGVVRACVAPPRGSVAPPVVRQLPNGVSPSLFLTVALVVIPLGVTACGGEDDSSGNQPGSPTDSAEMVRSFGAEASGKQAKRAAATLQGYLGALEAGRWAKACSYLAKAVRQLRVAIARSKDLAAASCGAGMRAVTEMSNRVRSKAQVSSVRLQGGQGYVLYHDSAGAEYAAAVKREAGRWKVSFPTELALSS